MARGLLRALRKKVCRGAEQRLPPLGPVFGKPDKIRRRCSSFTDNESAVILTVKLTDPTSEARH